MQDLNHGYIGSIEQNSQIQYVTDPQAVRKVGSIDKVSTYYEWGVIDDSLFYVEKSITVQHIYWWRWGQHEINPDTNTEAYYNQARTVSSNVVSKLKYPISKIISADANSIRFVDTHYGEYTVTKNGTVATIQEPVPEGYTIRGCVRYKEPDFVNPGDFQVAKDVRNLYSIYDTLRREWQAVQTVRSNPDMHMNKQYRLAGSADTNLAILANTIKSGDAPEAKHFNTLARNVLGYLGIYVPTVHAGTDAYATIQNNLIGALRSMSNTLNTYNNLWDNNDYCALSCQVACQASCMLACQSCHGGTCHNQNCGGWS